MKTPIKTYCLDAKRTTAGWGKPLLLPQCMLASNIESLIILSAPVEGMKCTCGHVVIQFTKITSATCIVDQLAVSLSMVVHQLEKMKTWENINSSCHVTSQGI